MTTALQYFIGQEGIDISDLRPIDSMHDLKIWILPVDSGEKTLSTWKKLQTIKGSTGHCPIVVGELCNYEDLLTRLRYHTRSDVIDMIRASKSFEFKTWAQARESQISSIFSGTRCLYERIFSVSNHIVPASCDCTQFIALIPEVMDYYAPAYLNFGGWQLCPNPEAHVGVLKRWREDFLIDIYAITDDSIELDLGGYPNEIVDSYDALEDIYLYCPSDDLASPDKRAEVAEFMIDSTSWEFQWMSP